jgi:hypothetical protein
MSLKELFESFELDFIDRGLHRSMDADEQVQFSFKAGFNSRAAMYIEKNNMWIKEKTQKVSLLMALEEITRPFPDSLTLDDLAAHNKTIREKYKLDDLPKEDEK